MNEIKRVRVAWRIVNFTSPSLICSVVSTFVKIRPGESQTNLLVCCRVA